MQQGELLYNDVVSYEFIYFPPKKTSTACAFSKLLNGEGAREGLPIWKRDTELPEVRILLR